MTKPDYCTQHEVDNCKSCSLSSYGRDCMNNPTWGGKREGAGRPIIHNDPDIRERTKKFRATDEEWEEFLDLLPSDSRSAFLLLAQSFYLLLKALPLTQRSTFYSAQIDRENCGIIPTTTE